MGNKMKQPMVVRRRFKGPAASDQSGQLRWYKPGEVVETDGWNNARSMHRSGLLRDPSYEEMVFAEGAGGQVAGRERASSTQVNDPVDPAPPSPSDDEEESEKDPPVVVELGGGWYNVVEGGLPANKKPIHGKTNAENFMESLV